MVVHRRLTRLAGNAFEISVVAGDKQWAEERIDNAVAEINRVFDLLSVSDMDSPINQINANAGINAVKVDQEVFNLVNRSLKISDLTRGAFDITHNYHNVIMDAKKSTIYLSEPDMQINLGSIVKGYATDRAKYVLQMQGVLSGVVNAFGDMITWGSQPGNKPWTIEDASPNQLFGGPSNLNISNMAISTLGKLEYHINDAGVMDEFVLNPKTGLPLHSFDSVSVFSPSAELAAAMSAPVKVMGVKMSLNLFNKLNQLVCVIVNKRKKVYTSKSISLMMF
ncbi:MAG: FAD:protein FMN transferase [Mucilaginibacter sp.]|uniref:FAD:protein FMN transferase n=1 Tax=Mucilaginibacter sp. TaxID=1882438 RepID=UPI003263128D